MKDILLNILPHVGMLPSLTFFSMLFVGKGLILYSQLQSLTVFLILCQSYVYCCQIAFSYTLYLYVPFTSELINFSVAILLFFRCFCLPHWHSLVPSTCLTFISVTSLGRSCQTTLVLTDLNYVINPLKSILFLSLTFVICVLKQQSFSSIQLDPLLAVFCLACLNPELLP